MVVAAIALVCAAASVSPAARPIRGLSLDILTALRWEVFGRSHDPAASPAVVIAMDEESLRTAPFKGAPMLTWTGEIGRVLSATLEGGAKVAGFDIVIPTSLELSEIPFGEGMLGEKVRGFDGGQCREIDTRIGIFEQSSCVTQPCALHRIAHAAGIGEPRLVDSPV